MFDWFKRPDYSNVVKFPEQVKVPHPYTEPPERDPTVYYTIGHTDDNRISIKMGYTTLTMNQQGIRDMISQLELFANQLQERNDE